MGSSSDRVKPRIINLVCACFSAKPVVLRRKSKHWLTRIRIMCPSGVTCLPADCFFQWASTLKIQISVFVLCKANLIINSSLKINLFSPWYSCNITEVALSNNHSLTQDLLQTIETPSNRKAFSLLYSNVNISNTFVV